MAFYAKVFSATQHVCLQDPTGKVMHAELRLNGAPQMLADEFPDMGYRGPRSLGGSGTSILLYVPDVDAVFAAAVAVGAVAKLPVEDQYDGDRRGTLEDPFGHVWLLASKKEDVPVEEIRRRFDAMTRPPSGA
jgi:PhnB protein